jgi:hypothetical protein
MAGTKIGSLINVSRHASRVKLRRGFLTTRAPLVSRVTDLLVIRGGQPYNLPFLVLDLILSFLLLSLLSSLQVL